MISRFDSGRVFSMPRGAGFERPPLLRCAIRTHSLHVAIIEFPIVVKYLIVSCVVICVCIHIHVYIYIYIYIYALARSSL